jgi:hypothetical protein
VHLQFAVASLSQSEKVKAGANTAKYDSTNFNKFVSIILDAHILSID